MPDIQGQAPAGINNAGVGPQGQEAPVGAGIQPGGLAGRANAPAGAAWPARHTAQHGEAPGQWQGLPRHQNDTAQPAFQGQTPAGINNAGAGPQGQEAPIGAGIQPRELAGMANAPTRQEGGMASKAYRTTWGRHLGNGRAYQGIRMTRRRRHSKDRLQQGSIMQGRAHKGRGTSRCWYPTGGTGGHGKCTGCGKESNYIN
jgi:hypothetical protein